MDVEGNDEGMLGDPDPVVGTCCDENAEGVEYRGRG